MWRHPLREPASPVVPLRPATTLVAALLVLAAVPQGLGPAAAEVHGGESLCRFRGEAPATVSAIVGGGTLALADGRHVVLAAIDLPVAAGAAAAAGAAGAGGAAGAVGSGGADALPGGSLVGRTVTISPVATDRYGRLRAHVHLSDGRWLQEALVEAGLARVHPQPGEAGCAALLLGPEAAARSAGRGVWADPAKAVRSSDEPSLLERSGLYELVEGRVVSVARGLRFVFIDFGRDFRRDFTVMVPLALADGMARSGMPPEDLGGRRVRVRGLIEESGGPAIRLADPVELELVDEGGAVGVGE